MDFVKKLAGNSNANSSETENQQPQSSASSEQKTNDGGFFGGLGERMNSAAGGGQAGEKNEDYLDKGIDMVQQKFMGAGDQSNESAVEQAKDEQISDFIRSKYRSTTGSDMPIKDKPTTFDKSTD